MQVSREIYLLLKFTDLQKGNGFVWNYLRKHVKILKKNNFRFFRGIFHNPITIPICISKYNCDAISITTWSNFDNTRITKKPISQKRNWVWKLWKPQVWVRIWVEPCWISFQNLFLAYQHIIFYLHWKINQNDFKISFPGFTGNIFASEIYWPSER